MNPIKYIHNGKEISAQEAERLEQKRLQDEYDQYLINRMVQYQNLTRELYSEGLIEIRVTPSGAVLCVDTRTNTSLWYLNEPKNEEEGASNDT